MKYDEKVGLLNTHYVENYDKLVKRLSYRAGGIHNAEDVMQEAYARALNYLDSFDPMVKGFGAWFNSVINNSLRDFKSTERIRGMARSLDKEENLADIAQDQEIIDKLMQEVESIPNEKSREILKMFVFLGYSAKEVARVVDTNMSNIRRTINEFYKYAREVYG